MGDLNNSIRYMLIIRKSHNNALELMNDGKNIVMAREEDKQILLDMGEKLLNDGLINRYQLVRTEGAVFGDISVPN